jgi:hypothetical protein
MSNQAMKDCTEVCWSARNMCEKTLFRHCLEEGGVHLEPDHVRVMMDCIDICQLTADSMVRNSSYHAIFCKACAEICEACADTCEDIGGDEMEACADECLKCAEYCRFMASPLQQRTTEDRPTA